MEQLLHTPLANIVRTHHAAAQVFEKHSLDYCCQGKRTLEAACNEMGADKDQVLRELTAVMQQPGSFIVDETDPLQLIGHILARHHNYVRRAIPPITEHLAKLVTKHGERYPYMREVQELFSETAEELTQHMRKEEMVLFPRIVEVFHLHENQRVPHGFISDPAHVMEADHEAAGANLFAIRELTNHYTPPADACTTHRVLLEELRDFEEDLHRHVHLENNVLFPLAEKMVEQRQAMVV